MEETGVSDEDTDNASVFIQWKGTNACFDFTCPCGEAAHFDVYFAYYVHCSACGRTWRMPETLSMVRVPHEGEASVSAYETAESWGHEDPRDGYA